MIYYIYIHNIIHIILFQLLVVNINSTTKYMQVMQTIHLKQKNGVTN